MNVVALTPPGRFPTVVFDPGAWWGRVESDTTRVSRLSLNAEWWRRICSSITPWSSTPGDLRGSWWCDSSGTSGDLGRDASEALAALCRPATYQNASTYLGAMTMIVDHLTGLNRCQRELHFSLEYGVRATKVNYSNSADLVSYACRSTLLRALIELALPTPSELIDLLVVTVTSPEDLLTAAITALVLKGRHPRLHVCLADHGFENFTLTPHMPRLRDARTLDSIFDTVIESKEERDSVLSALLRALASGERPRGFLRARDFERWESAPAGAIVAPPPTTTFAGEPILWTRVSSRRCYWGKCTFCVHNAKYTSLSTPSLREISPTVDRLDTLAKAGYRTFIFSDEALSPAMLERLSTALIARRLDIRWACRSKLELSFNRRVFERMHAAGCVEILFGLESISPRTLARMEKFVEGLDARAVHRIIDEAIDAGLGVHLNLIAGFPGDTPQELATSVDFTINVLRRASHATYALNYFTVFPSTPVAARPRDFGIELRPVGGDMPATYGYRLAASLRSNGRRVDRLYPRFQERLRTELGWTHASHSPATRTAFDFYRLSGHSVIFGKPVINRKPCAISVTATNSGTRKPRTWPLVACF